MATAIEWTEETWNPTTGCTKVSPGCAHCYAETLTKRYAGRPGWPETFEPWIPGNDTVVLHPDRLDAPLRWKKPSRVFVNSMSDLFHEYVPDEFIDRVFAVMALTPQHTFQVLTKRPERMREYMTAERTAHFADGSPVTPRNPYHSADFVLWAAQAICEADGVVKREYPDGYTFDWPLENCWLGVTVENQHFTDERIPILLDTPAAIRFISAEPLLGPVDITFPGRLLPSDLEPRIDWVICGGESGAKARPFNANWARDLLQQCSYNRTPFFMKQLGGFRPGNALEDLPEDLRVREYPS